MELPTSVLELGHLQDVVGVSTTWAIMCSDQPL